MRLAVPVIRVQQRRPHPHLWRRFAGIATMEVMASRATGGVVVVGAGAVVFVARGQP